MVLPHQEILRLCHMTTEDPDDKQTDRGIIIPCHKKNVRSAGYDLRLGRDYHLPQQKEGEAGTLKVESLNVDTGATITVPANRVVIVAIHESLDLPDDIVGHVSLKLDLLLKGLIMSSQSQIDAGYHGPIFALLYNLSNHDVTLSYLDPILRLELQTLQEVTKAPYRGHYLNATLAQSLRSPIGSSLYALQNDIVEARADARKAQFWTAAIAVLFAILTSIFTYFGPLPNRITKIEESTNVQGLSKDLQSLTKALEKEPEEKKVLREQLEIIGKRVEALENKRPGSRGGR